MVEGRESSEDNQGRSGSTGGYSRSTSSRAGQHSSSNDTAGKSNGQGSASREGSESSRRESKAQSEAKHLVENHKIPKESDICGVTIIGSTGIEWICINKPHSIEYVRHSKGTFFETNNPVRERHYMVNRWPYRER